MGGIPHLGTLNLPSQPLPPHHIPRPNHLNSDKSIQQSGPSHLGRKAALVINNGGIDSKCSQYNTRRRCSAQLIFWTTWRCTARALPCLLALQQRYWWDLSSGGCCGRHGGHASPTALDSTLAYQWALSHFPSSPGELKLIRKESEWREALLGTVCSSHQLLSSLHRPRSL